MTPEERERAGDRRHFVAAKDDRPWWARPGERIPACYRCNERPVYMAGLCGTCLANEAAEQGGRPMTGARILFGFVAVALFVILWATAQAAGAAFGGAEWLTR